MRWGPQPRSPADGRPEQARAVGGTMERHPELTPGAHAARKTGACPTPALRPPAGGGRRMREATLPHIDLAAGIIDYADTGGAGPVVVFTHGLPMSATQWRKVVPLLPGYRC